MDGDDAEFFFESEQLALKKNRDYYSLLKCIATLEAQKVQAIRDIEQLKLLEKSALNNPEEFIKQLMTSELKKKIPTRQDIADIPKIDWTRYAQFLPQQFRKHLSENNSYEIPGVTNSEVIQKPVIEPDNIKEEEPYKLPQNSMWTFSDQKRLEELLIQFPPEAIEQRRWNKIAKAMGNKTAKQVCSRIQKYFKKLAKHGLPIPGRAPKAHERKLAHKYRHQIRPSTFFPDNNIPVTMTDYDDDVPGPSDTYYPNQRSQDESDIQRKITLIELVKLDKEKGSPFLFHTNYKCYYCSDTPISGTRWHCMNCVHASIDFCTDCVINQLDSVSCHPLSHRIVPIRTTKIEITDKMLSSQNIATQQSYLIANSSNTSDQVTVKIENDFKVETEDDSYYDRDSEVIYDKDYLHQNYTSVNEEYNYLDTNFRPG